jgi:4-methyl-5(b-hydroxyethyl)-thiazole monophosphate biosynthesis
MEKKAAVLLATGFEEIEALTPVDVLRRAGVEVTLISVTEEINVTGAHNITVVCDRRLKEINPEDTDLIILPGGVPGTRNLMANQSVTDLLTEFNQGKKWIAAICAAPKIIGELGFLKNRKATCFPGFEHHLKEAHYYPCPAITDGHIITGRGIGAAMEFALEIVSNLFSPEKATEMRDQMVVPPLSK